MKDTINQCATQSVRCSRTKTNFRHVFTLAFAAIVVAMSVGCAGHSVRYPLNKTDKWQGPPIGGVLRVMPFEDKTTPITEKEVKVGDYTYRLNCRDYYEKKEIAPSATQMVVEHLRKSGMFTDVIGQNSPKPADMELTGAIADYASRAQVNKGAEATVTTCQILGIITMPIGILVFNGIGFAATSGMKSEVETKVTLSNMTLKKAGTSDVLWQNTINVSTNYVGHWNQSPLINADNCLRISVNDMIQQIGTSLTKDTPKAVSQQPQTTTDRKK